MLEIIAVILAIIIMYIGEKFIFQILHKDVCLKFNYKKDLIPVCGGIAFIPSIFITMVILYLLGIRVKYSLLFMLSIFLVSYVGLIDDLLGDRSVTGLSGHIKSLLHLKLTTGGLKAIIGFLLAFFVSLYISKDIYDIIINTIIISLFTNFMNLLDLRPGRAGKVFILLSLILLILNFNGLLFLSIVFGCLIAFLPFDLRGKVMMGDTGSNILGITLGIASTVTFHLYIRIVILLLLVIIHIIAEKYSITKIIENNRVLNFLDMLGRRH